MKGQCFFSFLGGGGVITKKDLLLAPDSGENTRHKIADKIKAGEKKVKGVIRDELMQNDNR
mgnify:CR=1 FL=1